jgi:hypothetical protein
MGKPRCYQKKNVAIIILLKDACALSFFKAPCSRTQSILQKMESRRAWIKFTSQKFRHCRRP